MNKSKFLKKSLALLLAFMLVFAMIPLGASAAGSLTINEGGAYLFEADGQSGGIQLTVDNENHTITGTYPLSRTDFVLDVLPSDDCSAVNYTADHVTDVPAQPMTKKANGRFHTPTGVDALPKNGYLSQEGGKDYIKMTVQLAGDGTNAVNYFVTLEVTSNEVVSELTGLRVWTSDHDIDQDQVSDQTAQPQLGITNINQDKKTIDITVPYDTAHVWVRDFAPENAGVTIGTEPLVKDAHTEIVGDNSSNGTWVAIATAAGDAAASVIELPVVVSSADGTSSSTTNYTLRLTRASGFESFKLKDGTDAKVFNKENKIVVVLPFGYKQDNKDASGHLNIVPVFDLTWADKNISKVKADLVQTTNGGSTNNQQVLTSGETKIKILANAIDERYLATTKKVSAAESVSDIKLHDGTISPAAPCAKITVEYVEGSSRTYDLIAIEAKENDQAVIHGLTIGTEEATIDEATRTINITLPYGTDVTKIAPANVKITASDNATLTAEYQSNVIFAEINKSASKEGAVDPGTRTVKRIFDGSTSTVTFNGKNAILRVVSQDDTTTRDYTLKAVTAATRETPALETVTLQDPDGVNYEGVLAADKHTFIFELPYKTQTIGDLNGWRLFWKKSVGSKVEGNVLPVSGAKVDATSDIYLSSNTDGTPVISATKNDYLKPNMKGVGIELSASETGINEQDKDTFYLMLTRKTPNAIAGLSKFSLASKGDRTATKMSYSELNGENTYPAEIKGDTITVKVPASHFANGVQTADTEAIITNAMFATGIVTNENNTVWYRHEWNAITGNDDEWVRLDQITENHASENVIQGIDCDGRTPADGRNYYWGNILVLCEQTSVDITKSGADNNEITQTVWDAAIAAVGGIVPANGYKTYKLFVKPDDAKMGGTMSALSLVDSRDRVADVALKVDTKNKIITGTVPYGMTTAADPTNKLFLKYTVSPMAYVLSGGVMAPTFNGVLDTVTGYQGTIASSTVGHFDNAGIHTLDNGVVDCDYLPDGGAYIQVTPDSAHIKGDVTLYNAAGNASDATKNQIVVVSEKYDTTKNEFAQKTEYTFDLNVAAARNDADIKTFSLNGFTGAISGNTINVTVSQGTDKTALIPTFTLSDGAYIKDDAIKSGETPLNFSTERLITVYAENGKTTKTYRVNVNTQEGFFDVSKDAWYYDAVITAFNNGWIDGVRPGYFSPNGTMTRAQFAKFIANIDGFDENQWTEPVFPDVDPESWYGPAVAYCVDKGYIKGFEDNTFKPNNNITREQMAAVICEAKGLKPVPGNTKFADDAKIGSWAKPYINACVNAGVISGKENNLYDPKANLKRCEGATVLVKAFGTSE